MGFPGFDSLAIERAVEFQIKKLKIRFATAEDLILLKLIAERSKDWMDIEGLTNVRYRDLDFVYIQNWLEQYAEILEEPDLISKYNQIVLNAKKLNAKN